MAIHVALHHQTRYQYDRDVTLSPQIIRLRPAPHCRTPILSYSLTLTPSTHFINWQQDPHSNYLGRVVFPDRTREFCVDVDLVAEMSVLNPFDFFVEPEAERFPFRYDAWLGKALTPFLEPMPVGIRLRRFLDSIVTRDIATIDFLVELNQRLSREISYIIRLEPGVQTPEETLSLASGSCRDSAWLLVQVLRHIGVAARFVSGYLIQLAPDVKALDGPTGAASDFTDLHAWAEAYLPGAGWIGLDPTSGLLAGEGHLPLAATPDPLSAAPVSGNVDESESILTHSMSVRRIYESPRVTKPYTVEQWRDIDAAGRRVDAALDRGDVRLTMGGEPTFVSIDDMDGAEWNSTALGPRKRELGAALVKRLRRRFAPYGLLHFGQGKWYPGESLPRWAFTCWWRGDGAPIWLDERYIADESIDYGYGDDHARTFAAALAQRLALPADAVIPAYEDTWYYLWKERRLPANVDPLQSELKDEEERTRLARIFEQGLDREVGYVLPIRRAAAATPGQANGWTTSRWSFRSGRLFLIPGDSPVGYRLPLESLPWAAPEDHPHLFERDPFTPLPAPLPAPLPTRQMFVQPPESTPSVATGHLEQALPARGESAAGIVRTALCVEARQGRTYVFMPPVAELEDYLDLVSTIEATAIALEMPVIIEGTEPPKDPRVNQFAVTPDPGVVEVNLQPAHSWAELTHHTSVLYEEARHARLGTEKFMLDGRHTGTGGGNHIVVGGATPADSPFLRRPDLLRSLLGYWHNHPSLSYLFSGLFIGPTSQHPRVDEARNDSVYELEIAFAQTPNRGYSPPWLVDRLFRNLLVDVTGNTHRAEFCIDKLYAPDVSGGRRGLVELRSFEMPPHPQMSLTQQLLLRSLLAWLWDAPYGAPLVRWGTELHDRFMLPHFVAQDLDDVLADLRAAGYPLQPEWFAPHVEFRFPQHGSVNARGVHLELRHALEPWHVMGEEPGAGGAVRYVDSSVERLQVKINGMVQSRYVVACNGRQVPLHPTGIAGECVAGVRYRAWQPSSSLHPTIAVHAPLVFDLVDTWNGRAVGGCVYHVAHPGGRNFETFPVNAYEAEGRRLARFSTARHTPAGVDAPREERNPEFPFTLDLRRPARYRVMPSEELQTP